MSTMQTPRSISLSVSTPSPLARPWQTTSSTSSPAACTHLITFWTKVWAPVTMWVSTSSRWPVMPSASLTPSCPSTVKARGSTWMIWRSFAMLTARAASIARAMSPPSISWLGLATATTPRLVCEDRWAPPRQTTTESARMPAMRSAPTIASWIAWTVRSMLTTDALAQPLGRSLADAGDVDLAVLVGLGDHDRHLAGAEVESGDALPPGQGDAGMPPGTVEWLAGGSRRV